MCPLLSQPFDEYMASLERFCCDCLGLRRKSTMNKDLASEAPTRGTHKENLLGTTTIDETRKASRKGGRPASKSPLPLDTGCSANGKAHENVHNKFSKASAKVSQIDSQEEATHSSKPVKETHHALRYEDPEGNKMINEYVRDCKIGTGSYGKVVLHRSRKDDKLYAIKIFHKSRLRKLRVAPAETALMDVLREVSIMKKLDHPNIVKLVEVIDDPESDYFYMVLEYVEGRWIFEGSGPPGGIGAATARKYFRDVVAGLMYLHKNHIVHGDIKPENLLISSEGRIKIGDFGVSRTFEDENDELRRSPGTPVYTAPECCLGVTYRGRAADVWALGCTLYCMVLGRYPFVGDTLQGTYERIVNDQFWFPGDMDPDLLSLLRGLLCKDIILRRSYKLCLLHPETDSPDMRVYEVNNVDSPTVKRSIFDLLLRLATSRSTFLRFWPSGAVDKWCPVLEFLDTNECGIQHSLKPVLLISECSANVVQKGSFLAGVYYADAFCHEPCHEAMYMAN